MREEKQGSFESAALGHWPGLVGYLTGAINVDSVLKFLALGENRERLANSGRVGR
jgi:hypothetical protein